MAASLGGAVRARGLVRPGWGEFESFAGLGVAANVAGRAVEVGSRAWLEGRGATVSEEAAAAMAAHQPAMGSATAAHTQRGAEVAVNAGRRATLTYRFASPRTVVIGCHLPGHFAQGMEATDHRDLSRPAPADENRSQPLIA